MSISSSFPSVENLAIGDDGTYIYGGSIGINRPLDYFRTMSTSPDRKWWSIYAISLYTLARNNFQKGMSVKELSEAITQDCRLLVQFIEGYASFFPSTYRRPMIVFYLPTYASIPENIRKEIKEGTIRAQLEALYEEYRSAGGKNAENLSGSADPLNWMQKSEQWILPCSPAILPFREVYRWMSAKASLRQSDDVLMLTHAPCDLHLYRLHASVSIIESYTAVVKTAAEFGTKLESSGDIPFNIGTHRAFGDSLHISPLLTKKKDREAVLELARQKKWRLLPESEVIQQLAAKLDIRVEELISYKF